MVLLHEEHLRRFVRTWRLALATSVNLPTDDPAYASLGALGSHVLTAAGDYLVWMCEVLTLPDSGIRSAPDTTAIVCDADIYMEHVLGRWRDAPLREVSNEQLETPEYPSQWQTRYCIDSMLEHAVMHPFRHAFQLDELIRDCQLPGARQLASPSVAGTCRLISGQQRRSCLIGTGRITATNSPLTHNIGSYS
jgi:hypothetical protein